MQRKEWLGLILTLVLIVLWVEAREGVADESPFVCARDPGEPMLAFHAPGSDARRCVHGAVGHLSDASSDYPAGRVP